MTNQLQARVEAYKFAKEVFEYVSSLADTLDDSEHYWKSLLEMVQAKIPKQENSTELVPMTDNEVTQFRRYEMDFGKYCGQEVRNVPLDYLDWLIGQPDNLIPFRRYLKNPSIAKLLEQKLEEGRNYD